MEPSARDVQLAVGRVLRRRPENWRKNVAAYVNLVEEADQLLSALPLDTFEAVFPEKGNCTVKARWEVIWLREANPGKTVGAFGLDAFLHAYRINDDIRTYTRLHDFVQSILRPRNVAARVQTLFFRACNIVP